MRSFLFGLAIVALLLAGGVALRLAWSRPHGLPGCPLIHGSPAPGHPAPVPVTGSYFHTGTVGDRWGDGIPREMPLDPGVLKRGAALYARDCRTCHGALGLGDGVTTRLPGGPRGVASLQSAEALGLPDGALFAVVTRGKGKMIGYGDTVPAADRWAIVAYVRALQASQHGTEADLALAPSPTEAGTGLGAPTPDEARRLATAGWIDRKAGTVHIPIGRALDRTLDRLRASQPSAPIPAGPVTPLP